MRNSKKYIHIVIIAAALIMSVILSGCRSNRTNTATAEQNGTTLSSVEETSLEAAEETMVAEESIVSTERDRTEFSQTEASAPEKTVMRRPDMPGREPVCLLEDNAGSVTLSQTPEGSESIVEQKESDGVSEETVEEILPMDNSTQEQASETPVEPAVETVQYVEPEPEPESEVVYEPESEGAVVSETVSEPEYDTSEEEPQSMDDSQNNPAAEYGVPSFGIVNTDANKYGTVTESNRRDVNWDRIADWCAEWLSSDYSQKDIVRTAMAYTGGLCYYQYGLSMFYPTADGYYGGTCYDGTLFLQAVCDYKGIPCETRFAGNDYEEYGLNYGQGSDHYNNFVWLDGVQYLANCQPGFIFIDLGFFKWEPEVWLAMSEASEGEPEHVHTFGVQYAVIKGDPVTVEDEPAWTETMTYERIIKCCCDELFATEDDWRAHYDSKHKEAADAVYNAHQESKNEETGEFICSCGLKTTDVIEWYTHSDDVYHLAENAAVDAGHSGFTYISVLLTPAVTPMGGETYEEAIEHPAVTHEEYPDEHVEKRMYCTECGYYYVAND